MFTVDELKAIAERTRGELRDEMELWNLPDVDDSVVSPGLMKIVVGVLARHYGVRRGGTAQPESVRVEAPPSEADAWPPPGRTPPTPKTESVQPKTYVAPATEAHVATLPATNGHDPDSWVSRLQLSGAEASAAEHLTRGIVSWRSVERATRLEIVRAIVRYVHAARGSCTQTEFDSHKPEWAPSANGVRISYDFDSWQELLSDVVGQPA